MANATKHIVVRLEMTVPEARELVSALAEFDSDHPTDPIFHELNRAIESLEEDAE